VQSPFVDCGVAITQDFYHLGCVFNLAWSQHTIPIPCFAHFSVNLTPILQLYFEAGRLPGKSFSQDRGGVSKT